MTDLEKHLLADMTCQGKDCIACFREFNSKSCPALKRVRLDDEELNKDSIIYKYAKMVDDCLNIHSDCDVCELRKHTGTCPKRTFRKLALAEYDQSGFDTLYSMHINDNDLYDILGE